MENLSLLLNNYRCLLTNSQINKEIIMQLKILLEKIQEEVSKNPDILDLEVYVQDTDSNIHKMRSVII